MKYAGVVVLYNPSKEVLKNIKSYIDELEILYVIDNTEKKSHEDWFTNMKKVVYIPFLENKGIAVALNEGASRAIKAKYDYLLTMDQDSCFEKGAVRKMKEFIERVNEDNFFEEIIGYKRSSIAVVSPFHVTEKNRGEDPRAITVALIVMTSGNFINLKIYKKLGGFKEWLFIDGVDFDYCLNANQNGYGVIQLNYVHLNHHLGNIEKKHFLGKTLYVSNHNYIRRYYISRNRRYIYEMYHDKYPMYCELEMKCEKKEWIKILLFEKDKLKKLKAMKKGKKDYQNKITGAMKE